MRVHTTLWMTLLIFMGLSNAHAGIFDLFAKTLRQQQTLTADNICARSLTSRISNSEVIKNLRALREQQIVTERRLNEHLRMHLAGLALDLHTLELAAAAAETREQYLDLTRHLADRYLKEGRIQEAASTYDRIGATEQARDLRDRIERSLKNSQVKFIRRIDFDKHKFNGKQKGKTESWLVETDDGILAVFKPEAAFWDDPEKGRKWIESMKGSESIKEVQGFLDDQILGTHLVPVTVFRDSLIAPSGTIKSGSLQYFYRDILDQHGYEIAESLWPGELEIEHWWSRGNLEKKDVPVWRRLRTGNLNFFDFITGNKDRHADNFKILPGGFRVGIDHAHSHGGPGNRWELHPTADNIHDFVPDDDVLERAFAMTDESFANKLREGTILNSQQVQQAQLRRRYLLDLIQVAGYGPALKPQFDQTPQMTPAVQLPDGRVADALKFSNPDSTQSGRTLISPKSIEDIVKVALAAATEVLAYHKSDRLTVSTKADTSSVTNADLVANKVIVEGLQVLAPHVPIISEESELPSISVRSQWRDFFILDPIDGTSGFIDGSDEFTINIAYIKEGLPEIGVVVVPAKGVVYFAANGYGSWKQAAGQPAQRIFAARPPLDEVPILVSSNHLGSSRYTRYFADNQIADHLIRGIGSSYKFCLVAEGAARAYVRLKGQHEWDVAAGAALYRFSGPIGSEVLPIPFVFNSESLKVEPFTIGTLK